MVSLCVCWKTQNLLLKFLMLQRKTLPCFECVPPKSLCWKLNPQCNSAVVRLWEGKVSGKTMPSWMDSLMILWKGLWGWVGSSLAWVQSLPLFCASTFHPVWTQKEGLGRVWKDCSVLSNYCSTEDPGSLTSTHIAICNHLKLQF